MCGASSQQKNAYAQTAALQNTLTGDFNKVFAGNQNILSNLTTSLNPIVAAGVGQFGYTPQETQALRSQAQASTAAATRQAQGLASEQLAGVGGGNQVLPSGAKSSILGNIAEKGAQANAAAQQGITTSGYEQGRQNYFQAGNQLASAPGQLENPATAMESGALTGTENLTKSADAITAANRAWEKPVLGAIGAVTDIATGGLSGVAGNIGDAADSAINSQI